MTDTRPREEQGTGAQERSTGQVNQNKVHDWEVDLLRQITLQSDPRTAIYLFETLPHMIGPSTEEVAIINEHNHYDEELVITEDGMLCLLPTDVDRQLPIAESEDSPQAVLNHLAENTDNIVIRQMSMNNRNASADTINKLAISSDCENTRMATILTKRLTPETLSLMRDKDSSEDVRRVAVEAINGELDNPK